MKNLKWGRIVYILVIVAEDDRYQTNTFQHKLLIGVFQKLSSYIHIDKSGPALNQRHLQQASRAV